MANESLILEMFERIKTLEAEVITLKEKFELLEKSNNSEENSLKQKSYTKMTNEMIDLCYEYGKKLYYDNSINPNKLADEVSEITGMNRNSASMYIYVVKNILNGEGFKRAINSSAIKRYFELIQKEFGNEKLQKAIIATKKYIEYMIGYGNNMNLVINICNEFERKYLK